LESFSLITQNVDGLHDRAGSRNLLKVHGDIWTLRCTVCALERSDTTTPLPELPPHCACGGMERPGVVWFGEGLPEQTWIAAQRAAQQAQILLVIGTSSVVYPAAGLAGLAKRSGAVVVEINIAETPVSAQADVSLRGPAAELLPQLVR
jgi:NAD-dependent deacetylase